MAVDMTVTEEVVSQVSEMTKPEAEAHGPLTWGWVETGVWTERMLAVGADRNPRLFAAVPPQNENHSILSGSFRTAAPAQGAMPAQA